MAEHGTAAAMISNQVNSVIVTQGQPPVSAVRTHTPVQPAPARTTATGNTPTGTSGTSGTGTPPSGDTSGSDTGTSGVSGGNDGSSNQTDAPAPTSKPTLDGIAIDEIAGMDNDKQEERYKELKEKGFDVDEIKNKVETAKATKSNDKPSGNDGRDKAGQVKGLMDDPDWGKPLDDKFDIQQGDFIEFLMKDVVLASAAWTGNKVFGITGYGIYKVGSSAYHWAGDNIKKGYDKYLDDRKKSKEAHRKNIEKINNENLYSGIIKHDDKTGDFAKKVLDARKKLLNDIAKDPEIKSAQALCDYVKSTIRGEMDLDNAVKGKDGRYTVTRNYKDDKDKEQSQKITVDEKTYQTLMSVHQNVQKTIGDRGNSPELRQAMEAQMAALFENRAEMLEKEKIFAADYAASILLEHAARLTPEELAKIKPEKELQNLANGEGKLAFYHHLYDIEHRKPEAFKSEVKKNSEGKPEEISALQVMSNAAHAALEESVKKLNNSQYQEAYMKQGLPKGTKKEPPHNFALDRIFINGKSEYAPELEGMTDTQRETSLKNMQQDAFEGYNRTDALLKEQNEIDKQISALAADGSGNQAKKDELNRQKKQNVNAHEEGTARRDAGRAEMLNNIRGNTK
ncbi:MAG: hypothetical protein IJ479_05645 [Alphaproteobacteria bacterium]|nr:hypothetical protein [Alphaproteobacteria bacterium]